MIFIIFFCFSFLKHVNFELKNDSKFHFGYSQVICLRITFENLNLRHKLHFFSFPFVFFVFVFGEISLQIIFIVRATSRLLWTWNLYYSFLRRSKFCFILTIRRLPPRTSVYMVRLNEKKIMSKSNSQVGWKYFLSSIQQYRSSVVFLFNRNITILFLQVNKTSRNSLQQAS